MNTFIKFNKGLLKMPFGVRLWLMLLIAINIVVPLFYFDRLEAQVILGALFASMMLMLIITARTGFTRLLGLGHILWLPLLFFLWSQLDQIPADDFFGSWVRALMVVNAVSLVIDSIDVSRYIAGDREETVKGL